MGAIKSVQADSITVTSESGGEVTAKLTPSTKILRVPPGEKDLKNATPLQPQDLQPGDRVLVRGPAAGSGDEHSAVNASGSASTGTITAISVIVMKQSDVAARQQQDREDWQKRGAGGLVTKVDATLGAITISSGGMGATRSIVVHIGPKTILRRYAAGSVKFDDAKPAPVDQIKVGDQLRARGTRSADGSELSAEEIVTGSFRNIAGTITAVDAAHNTLTVQDAIRKSPVVVTVSSESQMKKLPPEMAQRIATRLKGMGAGQGSEQSQGQAPAQDKGRDQSPDAGRGMPPTGRGSRPGAGADASAPSGPGGNAAPDFQRLLSRLPNSTLADLQKGDAVMIVSTEGADSAPVTAITLLAGVDAILSAGAGRSATSLLSPWSLSASAGEGEAAQ